MATLITLLQLLLVWVVAYLMGLAVVKALVPEDLERAYGTFITPTVGYLTFCFVSFSISAAFGLAAATSSWVVMGVLAAAAVATQFRPAWRIDPRALARDLRLALVLVLPMAVVTLWPLFHFGADTYVGAVNPDYFAGLMDNYYLLKGHSVTTFAASMSDSFYPIEYSAGHLSPSARFGGGIFGIAIHLLTGVEMRTALSLAVGFWMLNLPLTLYFLCRTAMSFDRRSAALSSWLIGISAPVGMSYLYYYLGQNSGLPALPLVMASGFLMLTRPELRTLAFCALLSNALFVNYFAMLPYALAPAGALGLYLVLTRKMTIKRALALAFGFLAVSAILKIGNLADTAITMRAWMNVIGQTLQGQFFLDFLTESYFPYFFGMYNYPQSPWLVWVLGGVPAKFTGLVLSLLVFLAFLGFVWLWARDTADKARRIFIISALVIYAVVWARYTFVQQYGYAVFKMSSWLQFIFVPFMAYGICQLPRLVSRAAPLARRIPATAAALVCFVYVGLNLTASVQYAYNGIGKNTVSGYIVNHFGMSDNRDFFELAEAAAKYVKPNESIGLLFTDSIRNFWVSYYLRDFRQSILAHETMPGDDENLPDVQTDTVVDYYGNVRYAINDFLHGGTSDKYYLTWNRGDINQDIAEMKFDAKPLWESRTFRLYRASDVNDVVFTGKGFYRLEYFEPIATYFFPRVMRWSAEGGEFFLVRVKHPGRPYRLVFDAIAGYRAATDSRILELWHDGKKFQEIVIDHSARVVSEPFYPTSGLNKLVVRVKDRNKPLPRSIVLWNKDIPEDYRRMNVGFSNVKVRAPDSHSTVAPPLGKKIEYMQLHSHLEQFNGFELDGWIGPTMQFTIPVPAGAKTIEVEGLVPGNFGFAFPFSMTTRINGRESVHMLPNNGDFKLVLAMAPGETTATVAIKAGQTHALGEENIRHKVINRSWKLDSVTFR